MAKPHITVQQFNSYTAGTYELIDNYSGEVFTDVSFISDALFVPEIAEAEVTAFYADGKDKYTVYFTRR